MKLHILSDLHVEFAPFAPPPVAADVVVLAGDIHVGVRGIAWARAAFPHQELVYVAGNHEFYRAHWQRLLPQLREEAAKYGVRFLENDQAVIGGVRFLGASLWTDFDYFGADRRREAIDCCLGYLADFRLINADEDASPDADDGVMRPGLAPGLLTPAQFRRRHLESRAWLEAQLRQPHDGATVVVTHHMPGPGSVAERFRDDLGNAGFASRLEHLMGNAALWIHGHTHDCFDYSSSGTRVLCNPRGYPISQESFENPAFAPGFTVEL